MKTKTAEKPTIGVQNIPAELRALPQWVNWKIEERDGKPAKVPYQPNGRRASTTDPKTWNTFERVAATNGDLAGRIGFVFTKESGYVGIDFDKCRNKKTEETEQWATDAIKELASYTEVSQSFTGWHVIVKGSLPPGGNRRGRIEMYDTGRFFCMTGLILSGCGPIQERDLSSLHRRMLAGEFDKARATKTAASESEEDFRLIREVHKQSHATDADALEQAFIEAYPDRYAERNRVKKGRAGKNYFRYSIERFLDGYDDTGESAALPLEKITDAGNADLLAEAERDNLLYCFEMKKWLFWDDARWQVDERQRARALMEKTMRARVAQVAASGSRKEIAAASGCLDTYRLTNGLHEAEKKLGVSAADLDTHPFLLTFRNGTLDLETMTLGEPKRTHFITKMVNHDYSPDAKPRRFLEFLKHAVGEPAMPYMQKLLGYSLTGDTSEKTFIIVWGESDTGKTTFLEIIRRLLEEYAVLLQVDTLMEKRGGDSAVQEDLVSLRGARLATTSELDQNRKLSIAAIKRIVQGQGKITASAKYEKKITFTETHKLWFDTNHLPIIPPDEQAVWNRVAVIVFGNPVPKSEQNRKLAETILREEAAGILAWMAEGERLRQEEGLGEAPKSFTDKKDQWRKKMDVIQQFIDECCEPGLRESKDDLYNAYVAWSGGPDHAVSPKVFTQRMARANYPLDAGRRHYLGVVLVTRSATEEK